MDLMGVWGEIEGHGEAAVVDRISRLCQEAVISRDKDVCTYLFTTCTYPDYNTHLPRILRIDDLLRGALGDLRGCFGVCFKVCFEMCSGG